MEEYNTVMYNGINLYAYIMNSEESKIIEEFRGELLALAEKLKLPKRHTREGRVYEGRFRNNPDYSIRYKEDCGYYVTQGERGRYSFLLGTPTKDRNEAFYLIMKQAIRFSSYSYECEHRSEFQNKWKDRFDLEYDSRKSHFEYTISKLYESFHRFDEELILSFTWYLNSKYDQDVWKYDYENEEFILI